MSYTLLIWHTYLKTEVNFLCSVLNDTLTFFVWQAYCVYSWWVELLGDPSAQGVPLSGVSEAPDSFLCSQSSSFDIGGTKGLPYLSPVNIFKGALFYIIFYFTLYM